MVDLREQLRTYFDDLTADVLTDATASTTPRAARHRGRVWVGIAAAVLVVAVVATFVMVDRGSDDDRLRIAGAERTVVELVGVGSGSDYQDLVFADPDTGATRRISLNGGCFCELVVVDGTVWGDDDAGVFRVDPPYESLVRVDAPRGQLFPTLDGSGLWTTSGRIGELALHRIDPATNRVGPAIPLPAEYSTTPPTAEVVGGILLFTEGYPRSLVVWDPERGRSRELATNVGNLGSVFTAPGADSSQVVYRDGEQRLHILDTASGRSVPITVDGVAVRGIGGGAFSPDGRTIAAFVNVSTSDVGGVPGGRIAQLMLVDAATGEGRVIEHEPVSFGEEYGWATWAPDGSRVFFGAGGPAFGVRPHETRATPLAVASNYTWIALEVERPTTPEPAPTTTPTTAPTTVTTSVPTTTTTVALEDAITDVRVYDEGRCTTADAAVVPCDQPHGNEEYASFSLRDPVPHDPGSLDNPATFAIQGAACTMLFEQYTGLTYADVRAEFSLLYAGGGAQWRCSLAGPRGGGLDVRYESAIRR